MKILTVDIGTGTQDIFLYNSQLDIENGFKLVVPSPTMMVRQQIKEATRQKQPILLTGVTMGGGPSFWAVQDHLRQHLPVFATPEAARTFNDDLDVIREMGIKVISEDETAALPNDVIRIELRDFNFKSIAGAFRQFGVSLEDLDALAIAVFDHGNAPPDVSDRKFRFDYLDQRIRTENRLSAFAYLEEAIPRSMTRMQAVAKTAHKTAGNLLEQIPLILMDTAPAAVLGATLDPFVAAQGNVLLVNVGNLHTLAFRMQQRNISGVFEHHTGLLNSQSLETWLLQLVDGTIQREAVFNDHGHGALIYPTESFQTTGQATNGEQFRTVVTGPRRSLLTGSSLTPYFAAPFGDMMLSGCYGLLAATAELVHDFRGPILSSLSGLGGSGAAPWKIN